LSCSAILALADGTFFKGVSIGASGFTVGEIVFNTSMTGYQEILTDPSYSEQIVTLTYPHIGNVGVNTEDMESKKVWAKGLVVRELSPIVSNWRSEESLTQFLVRENVVAIAGIDTRALTRHLRAKGVQGACILAGEDVERAISLAKEFPGLSGLDLARVVSTQQSYPWQQSVWRMKTQASVSTEQCSTEKTPAKPRFKVVAYDFGVKLNILRLLVDRDCEVLVVPAETTAEEVLAQKPDGVFLSNGPGDPEPCTYAIRAVQAFLAKGIPLFGICLGHQILALAAGAQTVKMKLGHHGANHPVQCLESKKVFITSQNHGFTVDEETLPSTMRVTHVSLFDGTVQGIHHNTLPAFGFQGHPEASPGPQEACVLFDHFIELMSKQR
jgi:carbamoyl-phosphate synthase small subunit